MCVLSEREDAQPIGAYGHTALKGLNTRPITLHILPFYAIWNGESFNVTPKLMQ